MQAAESELWSHFRSISPDKEATVLEVCAGALGGCGACATGACGAVWLLIGLPPPPPPRAAVLH
jgi:hypothetical protein